MYLSTFCPHIYFELNTCFVAICPNFPTISTKKNVPPSSPQWIPYQCLQCPVGVLELGSVRFFADPSRSTIVHPPKIHETCQQKNRGGC